MTQVALWVFVGLAVLASAQLAEKSFEDLKSNPEDKIVVFFRSSSMSEASPILSMVKRAVKRIRKQFPNVVGYQCDGDLAVNKQAFIEATFNTGTWVFTTTMEHGIEQYSHEREVDVLVSHMLSKLTPVVSNDVVEFPRDEDAFYEHLDSLPNSKPVFVKFYEDTCTHCQRMKKTFQRAATAFKDRVEFMDCKCSRDSETSAFCSKSGVRSYPTLVLFTGEDKLTYEEADRSHISFDKFFNTHGYKAATSSSPPAPAEVDTDDAPVIKEKPKPKGKLSPAPAAPPQAPAAPPAASSASASSPPASASAAASEIHRVEARMLGLESKLDRMESLLLQLVQQKQKDEL